MAGEKDQVTELSGQVADLGTQIADMGKKLEKMAADGGEPDEGTLTEFTTAFDNITKSLETITGALEASNAENETLAKVVALTPKQRAHYDTLEKAEDKKWYLNLKDKEKDEKAEEEMEKRAKADESVVIGGDTIKKSAVGEVAFNLFKKQAERQDALEKQAKEDRENAQMVTLKKRADDEFPHVPGTVDERAAMLKAIAGMDESLQKSFTAVFTQSQKLGKAGFDKVGGGDGSTQADASKIAKAKQDFETKVSEIKKRDKSTGTVALAKARKEFPDLFKAYQDAEKAQ